MFGFFKKSQEDRLKVAKKAIGSGQIKEGMDKLLELALEGYPEAEYTLGDIFEFAVKNLKEAAKWYSSAADHGHANAQRCIADMLISGKGVSSDPKEAFKYYAMAAKQGNAEAQFVLGEFYRNGKAEQSDIEKAKYWYNKAKENGFEQAASRLEQLNLEQSTNEKPESFMRIDFRTNTPPKPQKIFEFLDDRSVEENNLLLSTVNTPIIKGSLKLGLIKDNDLARIPEAIGVLAHLAAELRDDLYAYHDEIKKPLQFPIIRNQFCYAFAKGVEAAYLWNESADGNFEYNYDIDDALNGRAGAQVSKEFSEGISLGMVLAGDVFCDFQDLLADKKYDFYKGGRYLADAIATSYFWASQVGIDYGMNMLGFE